MQNRSNNRLQKIFIKFTPGTRIGGSQKQRTKSEQRNTRSTDIQHRSKHPAPSLERVTQHPQADASPCGPPKVCGVTARRARLARPPAATAPLAQPHPRPRSRRPLPLANQPPRPFLGGASGGKGGPLGCPLQRGLEDLGRRPSRRPAGPRTHPPAVG